MKYIELTQGKRAIVDDEDYMWLNQKKWRYDGGYALRSDNSSGKYKALMMHRAILKSPSEKHTDHINHNGLDNRKVNLRICTRSQNQMNRKRRKDNRSGYKGVCWKPDHKKWLVEICYNKTRKHIGYYFCLIRAAKAYDAAARKFCGEFALTNFAQGDG